MGLRELKKERTRHHIADVAGRLFAERGFDRVSVAQVAHEAQVAEATVFNYFRTKEDLFYSRLETFETRLVEAIKERDPGEPVAAAFRRYLLATGGLLAQVEAGDADALERLRTMNRVISASPALLAREQQVFADATAAVAAALAAEQGIQADDVGARVAANALMGVHRALIDYVRHRVLSDEEPGRLAAEVADRAADAFDLLDRGLRDYAPGK
jgi:AcrR family transcriptional regulator